MATADVNGAVLHYETVGEGPPALVLHGGLGVDHTVYRTLDPLADHLRLIHFDHRGNGRSSRHDVAGLSMEQWADDAAALARRLCDDEPVVVIGHSYGGFIAQEMAIRHGGAISALVLVATTPGQLGDGELPAPDGPPVPPEFLELLVSVPESDEQLAATMPGLAPVYLHTAPPSALAAALHGTVYDAAAMRRGFEVLASWSSVDRLGGIEVPTLVVAGRHDALTAWPQAERIASRLPDAELVVFEESSHFPWLDEPDRFFSAVVDWLRRRRIIA